MADELEPMTADARRERWTDCRPTRAGRAFGGVLCFLAIWQVLAPGGVAAGLCGWLGLGVAVLWLVPCPAYVRWLATAALLAAIVVLIRLEPDVPRPT